MVTSYIHCLYILIVTLLAFGVQAAPTPAYARQPQLARRQSDDQPFEGPKTITTNRVIPVNGGSIVEDCVITFTGIVVDGKNLVREERKCSELFVPAGQPLPAPSSPPGSTGSSSQEPPAATTTTTTTEEPPATSPSPTDVSTTTTTSSDPAPAPPPAETTTTTDSPSTTDDAPPAESSSATDSAPASSDAPSSSGDQANPSSSSGGVVVLGPTSVPAEGAITSGPTQPSGTRGSAEASTSASGVNIPGKEIEVLPIGLGVFAGISVIALIVVGLVTYQRTLYRKAFRQRLAANAAQMGYGGMAERS